MKFTLITKMLYAIIFGNVMTSATNQERVCYNTDDKNPCNPSQRASNRYYFPSCTSCCFFIQCDEFGVAFDKQCAPGTGWDNNLQTCTRNQQCATTAELVNEILDLSKNTLNSEIFLYQTPTLEWVESDIYRFNGFSDALQIMNSEGVAGKTFYLGYNSDGINSYKYGIVNVAAFLAQSMHETIQYNACDENNWDLFNGKYPISNSCGQLGQSYQDYHCSEEEKHMECTIDPTLEIHATTNAKWWGAPMPLFCAPKSKYPFTGYWDHTTASINNNEPYANRNGRVDVEGCCYWGRGVIQTTGVCNFGKLNYFLGKRANDEGRLSQYPNIDFCKQPDAICSPDGPQELKWITGMFYWLESVEGYDKDGWNYIDVLKQWVDDGMSLSDTSFIDSVSGIVNRGCHNPPCQNGEVHGNDKRRNNFAKLMNIYF